MTFTQAPQGFIIRLEMGEDLHRVLAEFCRAHAITAGILHIIGAVRNLELAYYHLKRKEYEITRIAEDLEVVGCTGNIAQVSGAPFLHIHGVFTDRYFRAMGGHVKAATVAATCEVHLLPFAADVRRVDDATTGLKLCEFGPTKTEA